MNHLYKACLAGGAALLFVAGLAPPAARADFSTGGNTSPPGLSYQTFRADFTAVTQPLVNTYDFQSAKGNVIPDGKIVSQVYQETDGKGTLYAYVYQIQAASNSPSKVLNYSVDWSGGAFAAFLGFPLSVSTTPGDGFVYQIGSLGTGSFTLPSEFRMVNLVANSSATGTDYSDLTDTFSGGGLVGGKNSQLLVVFSATKPSILPVLGMTDGGSLNTPYPEVYAPAPEPPALALCGIGVVGLFGGAVYRRLRQRPSLA